MDVEINPELRAAFDHRVERARLALEWAQGTADTAEAAYDKALKTAASIYELDEFRFDRESAQVMLARCQGDLDRLLDWRSHETGAPR